MSDFNPLFGIDFVKIIKRVKVILLYLLTWLLITCIMSLVIGACMFFFHKSLSWATEFRQQHTYIIYFLPFAGAFIVALFSTYLTKDQRHTDVIVDGVHQKKHIPFKIAPMVYTGTILTHLFGGSAGREGAALQITCSLIAQFSKIFKFLDQSRDIILRCAISGGFAAIFGAPIAAAVFAMEVIWVGKIKYTDIVPVFMSAIFSFFIAKLCGITYESRFIFIDNKSLGITTIVYSIALGVIFGLTVILFSNLTRLCSYVFTVYVKYEILRPVFAGILIIILSCLVGPRYLGLGLETIQAAFVAPLPIYIFALKIFMTALTLSCGFKGGEVTPLFFIGATLGSALSVFLPLPTALLASMGFTAVLAGAANTPLACIFLGVELFGTQASVYIAACCIISYFISGHYGIYQQQRLGVAKLQQYHGRYVGQTLKEITSKK